MTERAPRKQGAAWVAIALAAVFGLAVASRTTNTPGEPRGMRLSVEPVRPSFVARERIELTRRITNEGDAPTAVPEIRYFVKGPSYPDGITCGAPRGRRGGLGEPPVPELPPQPPIQIAPGKEQNVPIALDDFGIRLGAGTYTIEARSVDGALNSEPATLEVVRPDASCAHLSDDAVTWLQPRATDAVVYETRVALEPRTEASLALASASARAFVPKSASSPRAVRGWAVAVDGSAVLVHDGQPGGPKRVDLGGPPDAIVLPLLQPAPPEPAALPAGSDLELFVLAAGGDLALIHADSTFRTRRAPPALRWRAPLPARPLAAAAYLDREKKARHFAFVAAGGKGFVVHHANLGDGNAPCAFRSVAVPAGSPVADAHPLLFVAGEAAHVLVLHAEPFARGGRLGFDVRLAEVVFPAAAGAPLENPRIVDLCEAPVTVQSGALAAFEPPGGGPRQIFFAIEDVSDTVHGAPLAADRKPAHLLSGAPGRPVAKPLQIAPCRDSFFVLVTDLAFGFDLAEVRQKPR